jgi:hypothetical protein
MILITIAPLGTVLTGAERWVFSVFWVFLIRSSTVVFNLAILAYLWAICPLYLFSILYIRQIVRFLYGKSSRDSALMCGLLSIVFPSLMGLLVSILLGYSYSQYLYIVPIPLQFVIGLYFLYRFREPEVVSPWSGQFLNWSWWKRLGTKWSNWITDRIDLHFEEEEIVMGMSVQEVEDYYVERYRSSRVLCEECGKRVAEELLCKACRTCLDCCQCDFDEYNAEERDSTNSLSSFD